MTDRVDSGRASERKPVGLRIRLAFGDLSEFVERFAINISDGGIFIRTRDPRPVGTKLSFELRLRSEEVAFSGNGTVRWIQSLDSRGLGTPGMGIEFNDLTDESRSVLARILALREKQELPEAVEPALPTSWRPLHEFPTPEPIEDEEEEPKPPPVMVPVMSPGTAQVRAAQPRFPQSTPLPRLRPDGLMLPESHNARPRTAWMGMPQPPSVQWADGRPGGEEEAESVAPLSGDRGATSPSGFSTSAVNPASSASIHPSDSRSIPSSASNAPSSRPSTASSTAPRGLSPTVPGNAESRADSPARVNSGSNAGSSVSATSSPGAGLGGAETGAPPPSRPRRRSLAVGLDIGWSVIRVAVASEGVPRQVPLHDGGAFPALVAAGPNGPAFGADANTAFESGISNLVRGLAHVVGLPRESPFAKAWEARVSASLAPTDDGSAGVLLNGTVHCAKRLLTGMLEKVRECVESVLHADIERTVLTVPSFFSTSRRSALREAADAAGFRVDRVIDSALASVLGCHGPRGRRRVLAVNVGGGITTASVVEQSAHVLELMEEESLPSFGGFDLERVMLEDALRMFENEAGVRVPRDEAVIHRVLAECSTAKSALNDSLEVEMSVPSLVEVGLGRADLHQRLTRARMLHLLEPHFDTIASLAVSAMEAMKLRADDFDTVLLLGAQTQTGALARRISERVGKEAVRPRFAAEAAALGAALVAEPERELGRHMLIGAVGASLSLGLTGGKLQKLLDRRTALPAERHFVVPVSRGARELELFLFQGEEPSANECDYVGALLLGPLEPSPDSDRHVSVKVSLNEEGMLSVSAMESRSGATVPVSLTTSRDRHEAIRALSLPAA